MRTTLALATVILLALAPTIEAAGTRTETQAYVASGDFVTGSVAGLNVGGAGFTPRSTDVAVSVEAFDDVSGNAVTLTVCQDFNDDGFCGDAAAGEPNAVGCGFAELGSSEGFDPRFPVTVFVQSVGPFLDGGCLDFTPVTTGNIMATFTQA